MNKRLFSILALSFVSYVMVAQNLSSFTSVTPTSQTDQFIIPTTHVFQKISEVGDPLSQGGVMPERPDFAGYMPISGSAINGYLSVNSEGITVGGVTVFDINFNAGLNLWEQIASEALDFTSVAGTIANCSGTVTPWNTIISCEEIPLPIDNNADGYNDFGWNVEIDPATKTVLGKRWAMGNFAHENVTIHTNERTVYQGADSTIGYLYKFVANTAQDLSDGELYVYAGAKDGSGSWIQLENTTIADRNSTLTQSSAVGGTVFEGVEDVEIGPDGMVYFAVKREDRVYRFSDSDPLLGSSVMMETYVGNVAYDIAHVGGVTSVNWGTGNDNLAFDNEGNLWVQQDGDENYIWVVENGHTQANPKVKLFGIAPVGAESTGITFTPDNKYMFLSIQAPSASNVANQLDAAGTTLNFDKGVTLVIALNDNLGSGTLAIEENGFNKVLVYPNPVSGSDEITITGTAMNEINVFTVLGELVLKKYLTGADSSTINVSTLHSGVYILYVNGMLVTKLLVQ